MLINWLVCFLFISWQRFFSWLTTALEEKTAQQTKLNCQTAKIRWAVKEDPELTFSAAICRDVSTWMMSENVWMQKNAVVKSDDNIPDSEQ